ncbi:MAG: transporter substrate-binding protein [Betaproteobacteria bacterium]|jgi:tripartite-type tricarboxylate transporter receptor subunit TctC|nr:transporter substrate-binding protein [Betaproteobacteria bacterium]
MRKLQLLILGAALAGLAPTGSAQEYPAKTIRVITPYGAGGASDIVVRAGVEAMSKELGQSMVVENRTGAGGTIGFEAFAASAPDGYTLLGTASSLHGIAAALYTAMLKRDPNKDIEPVIVFANVSNILVVRPSLPVKSVKDLIELAGKQPGKLTFVSAGVGTSVHMGGELFNKMAGVQMTHVPYRSSVAALVDLMADRVDVMFDNIPSALPHVKAGKLRALATTGAKRPAILPELPTIAEQGLPGYEAGVWIGLLAPLGTPKPIIAKLNAAGQKAVKTPEFVKRMNDLGYEVIGGTPEQMRAMIDAEVKRMHPIVKASGAKPE